MKGGLVKVSVVEEDGVQVYSLVEYTFDFCGWGTFNVPPHISRSLSHLEACIPIQLAAADWASTGLRVGKYAIHPISSLDRYQLEAGTNEKTGEDEICASPLSPHSFKHIKIMSALVAEEWEEYKFYHRSPMAEDFFRFKKTFK